MGEPFANHRRKGITSVRILEMWNVVMWNRERKGMPPRPPIIVPMEQKRNHHGSKKK